MSETAIEVDVLIIFEYVQWIGLWYVFIVQYQDEGYLVLDGLLSPEECDALRDRMSEIIERMDVPEHCRTQFSTDHDEQLKIQVNSSRWIPRMIISYHLQ